MTEKNESEELPFCGCGCGERVKNIGRRFISGHNTRVNHPMKGTVGWNKDLTKETNSSVKRQSEKLTGRRKETHDGVRKQSEKLKGRTNKTHRGIMIMTEKRRGRNKKNDESVRRGAEKRLGRKKETHECVRRQSEKTKGRTKEKYEYLRKKSEEMKKKTGALSLNWQNGISFLPYCDKFNENLKELVRDYFGRCCYLCGKNEAGNGRKLSVHHVNYNKLACCDEKIRPLFVPLYMSCHSKVHTNREEWEELFTTSLDFLTHGECFIHKSDEAGGEKIK